MIKHIVARTRLAGCIRAYMRRKAHEIGICIDVERICISCVVVDSKKQKKNKIKEFVKIFESSSSAPINDFDWTEKEYVYMCFVDDEDAGGRWRGNGTSNFCVLVVFVLCSHSA